jgi:hypothetical protein
MDGRFGFGEMKIIIDGHHNELYNYFLKAYP